MTPSLKMLKMETGHLIKASVQRCQCIPIATPKKNPFIKVCDQRVTKTKLIIVFGTISAGKMLKGIETTEY